MKTNKDVEMSSVTISEKTPWNGETVRRAQREVSPWHDDYPTPEEVRGLRERDPLQQKP